MKFLKSFYTEFFSVIFIFCLGVIVYSNTFLCPFHFDDTSSIVNNPYIRNILDLQGIWNFLPRRFLVYLSIAINYHFNQLDVLGYHLFNVAVHLGSAILVWWLTLLTLSTPAMKDKVAHAPKISQHANLIALMAGLVFVSHPVQTEAVTYICQRAASMATLFYLASLCFYVKSRLQIEGGSNSKFCYVSSLVTAIMAMFTKEIAITLPLVILLYEFSFFNIKKNLNWKYLTPFLLTLFIIPVTMFFSEQDRMRDIHGTAEGLGGISPIHYLLTQFRVMVTYIRLVFLPFNQNLDYDYPISSGIFELPTLFSFLFLLSILFLAKRLFLNYRLVSFSIFWFFLTLLPESSVLPITDVIFEHRLYLPLAGFSMLLVSGIYYLFGKNSIKRMVILLMIIIACNSVLTYQRNKVWKDDFTLWNDAVQKSPHKERPYYNRGCIYMKQRNFAQAILDFNKAIEIDPTDEEAYYNRGNSYLKQGNFTQARADYNKAIEIRPAYAEAHNNRGFTYYKQGNYTQAILDFNMALKINPNLTEAYTNQAIVYNDKYNLVQVYNDRGLVYYKQGNYTQAISDFNKAIAINPKAIEAYNNRGNAYDKEGNLSEAISDYNKAVKIDPRYAETYSNRGFAYYKSGNATQAMLDFNKAIEINPNFEEAYGNRGQIYYYQGRYAEALSDYNKAIEINPKDGHTYNNRALVYYYLGEYDRSWADVHKAEELGVASNPKLIDALKH